MADHPALAVRFGAMGDMVMFTAVLRRLARHHGAPVDVLCSPGASAAVLAGVPEVGRVFTLKHRKRPWWFAPDLRQTVRAVLERTPRHAYIFEAVNGLEARLTRAGCAVHQANRPVPRGTHAVESQHLGLDACAVPRLDGCELPGIVVSASERAAAREVLAQAGLSGPVLVVQVGSSRTMRALHRWRPARNLKAWPLASWTEALTAIARRHPGLALAFAGAPPESADIDQVRATLPTGVRSANLAQVLPVRTLVGLLAEAQGCLSVDTGPAHLAAAVGCPLVVLFGPADHRECLPRGPGRVEVVRSGVPCSPCHGTPAVKRCRDNICMQRLPVAGVLAAWERLGLAPG